MTIAQVSRQYGLSADTLRYYEKIGLLPPVPRTKEGIRITMSVPADGLSLSGTFALPAWGSRRCWNIRRCSGRETKRRLERKALLVKQRELMAQDICHRQEMLCRLDQKIEEGE